MKKLASLIVCICTIFMLSSTVAATPYHLILWHPVCRHNAIFWAVTVGEQYPTRVMYGWFTDNEGKKYYHVQPQVYIGDKWWYFEVVDNTYVRIITKPRHVLISPDGTREETVWFEAFMFSTLDKYLEHISTILKKVQK